MPLLSIYCRRGRALIRSLLRGYKYFIALYGVTFCLALPIILCSNSRSPYFKLNLYANVNQKLEDYKCINDERKEVLTTALDALPLYDLIADRWQLNKTRLLITVITTARDMKNEDHYSPHYLTQVVSKLLTLNQHFRSDTLQTRFLTCDVEKTTHTEAENLAKYMNIHHQHEKPSSSLSMFEVMKRNYMYCLNTSHSFNPHYILLVEDDALPHENLFQHLEYLLHIRLKQLRNPLFGFIKLYHPDWLNGYITGDLARLSELFAIPIVFTALTLLFKSLFFNTNDFPVIYIPLIYLYFLLCILLIGRINVNYFRTISFYLTSLVPAPSCCTPANLFSFESAQRMVNYLNQTECKKGFAYDSAMDRFYKYSGLKSWFYEPKLFDHIGVFSTHHKVLILDPTKTE